MNDGKIPYLYIAGASYSGSTLLAFMLNAHPQMASISEICGPVPGEDIETYLCSCGKRFLDCPFYRELEKRIRSLGSSFSLRKWRTLFQVSRLRAVDIPLVRPLRNTFLETVRDCLVPFLPGYKKTISEIARRNVHLAKSVLAITGKNIFVDAQKDPMRIKFLSEMDELDLKVIHLVRDVRGGAASYLKHSGRSDASWAARAWLKANENTERARRFVSADQWLRIRYCDLCNDYQAWIDRISDFVGAERAEIKEDFFKREHHIFGNVMRLKPDQRVTLDESWKQRLSEEDLEAVARVGGKANRYFGYDWPQQSVAGG